MVSQIKFSESREAETNYQSSFFCETGKYDGLIVIGEVLGIFNKLSAFISPADMIIKFKNVQLYIFHVIYLEKTIWH